MSDEREREETMGGEIRVAYCSACDREVRLQVPAAPVADESSQESAGASSHLRGVCLDVGDDCTGAFCPFGDQPPIEKR
ncbi:MAG: hypothetical protein JSV95_09920 [Gemmatimonadota bacterium]|nr:MAG: hypothetical protein JSV95_09920 [Gemmatimonadota bacterium]